MTDLRFDPAACLIGARAVTTAATLPVEDPSTGAVFASIPRGGRDEIDAAVAAAEAALEGAWGRADATERGRALAALGRRVEEHVEDLARIEARMSASRSARPAPMRVALARYLEFYGGAGQAARARPSRSAPATPSTRCASRTG
jgi:aldehyde dehydrogenase (NAD+)